MKKEILGVVRHALTVAGGYLAASGVGTGDEMDIIAAGIVTAIGVGWSIRDKKV